VAKKAKKRQTVENFDAKKFIIAKVREVFRKAPHYSETKKRAKEDFTVPSKHGKLLRRVHFKCAHCGGFFLDKAGSKEIAVDHIDPVIDPDVGWVDFNTFIDRLFCDISGLQILCNYPGERDGKKSCHRIKTNEERRRLRETEKKNKE
jgi:hypothetical protein